MLMFRDVCWPVGLDWPTTAGPSELIDGTCHVGKDLRWHASDFATHTALCSCAASGAQIKPP